MAIIDPPIQADLIATAHAMADAARPEILAHFRQPGVLAENKLKNGFDPVTIADRNAEKAMRAVLAKRRPDDSILGEEFEPVHGSSGFTWVIDPIDGTRSFISGAPTWGVLIAVNAGEGPLFGLIDQPYIGERFCGGFDQAYMDGPMGRRKLATRSIRDLSDAILFSTFPEIGTKAEETAFRAVSKKVKLVRFGTDCYAYALLALGQIDLIIEAGLNPYDVQGPIAVVEAAGGITSNWQGKPAHNGGQLVAAGSAEIHAQALEILNRA